MYFWKIKKLKDDIVSHKVSKQDELLYLFLFVTLYMALFIQAIVQINSLWNMQMVLLQIFISFAGIAYAFFKNGGLQDFIKHFTSVGWVFLLRSLFFMSIGMLNLYVMTYIFGFEELFSAKNSVLVAMAFELLLYWRIGKHIESLNVIESDN